MRFGMREMFFVLLLLGMPVAAYFFVFEPRNQQMEEARTEIQTKLAKLQQLEVATAAMDDLDAEIRELEQKIAMFEEKLPGHREEQVILSEVWQLAAANHVKVTNHNTGRIERAAAHSELPINLTISGDFDGFYEFLLAIERLPRITRMKTMSLRKQDKEGEGQMQAELVLSIFFEGSAA